MMRRLDVELVRRRLVESRNGAVDAIRQGKIQVGGILSPKPSTLVAPGTPVRWSDPPPRFVGRGGLKLEAALDRFDIKIPDRDAIDVGASTGGFTDCLLQNGARSVAAVDVGYGQIHERIRHDERVRVVEKTNIRHADPQDLGAPFDIVTVDVSFISLLTIARKLVNLGSDNSDYILLIKPQFESGPGAVNRRGVLTDSDVWRTTVNRVLEGLNRRGLGLMGLTESPIRGTRGNREVLGWFRWGAAGIDEGRAVGELG